MREENQELNKDTREEPKEKREEWNRLFEKAKGRTIRQAKLEKLDKQKRLEK